MLSMKIPKTDLVKAISAVEPKHYIRSEIDHLFLRKGGIETVVPADSNLSEVTYKLLNSISVSFDAPTLYSASAEILNGANIARLSNRVMSNLGNQALISKHTINKTAEIITSDVLGWVKSLNISNHDIAIAVEVIISQAIIRAFTNAGLITYSNITSEIMPIPDKHVIPNLYEMMDDIVLKEVCNAADVVISSSLAVAPKQKSSKGEVQNFITHLCSKLATELVRLVDLFSNIGLLLSIVKYNLSHMFIRNAFLPLSDINLSEIITESKTCFNLHYTSAVGSGKSIFHEPSITVDFANRTASFSEEVAYRFPAIKSLFTQVINSYHRISLAEFSRESCYSYSHDRDGKLSAINVINPLKRSGIPQLLSKTWAATSPVPNSNYYRALLTSSINDAIESNDIYRNIQKLIDPSTLSECYSELARVIEEINVQTCADSNRLMSFSYISNLSLRDQYAIQLILALAMCEEAIFVPLSSVSSYGTDGIKFVAGTVKVDKYAVPNTTTEEKNKDESDKNTSTKEDGSSATTTNATTDVDVAVKHGDSSFFLTKDEGLYEGLDEREAELIRNSLSDQEKFNSILALGDYVLLFRLEKSDTMMIRNIFDSSLSVPRGSLTPIPDVVLAYYIPKQGIPEGARSSNNLNLSNIISNVPGRLSDNLTITSTVNLPRGSLRKFVLDSIKLNITGLANTSGTQFSNMSFDLDISRVGLGTTPSDQYVFLTKFACYDDFRRAFNAFIDLLTKLSSQLSLIKQSNTGNVKLAVMRSAIINRVMQPMFNALAVDNKFIGTIQSFIANESYRYAYNNSMLSSYLREDILKGIDNLLSSGLGNTKSSLTFVTTAFFLLAYVPHTAKDKSAIVTIVNDLLENTIITIK